MRPLPAADAAGADGELALTLVQVDGDRRRKAGLETCRGLAEDVGRGRNQVVGADVGIGDCGQ